MTAKRAVWVSVMIAAVLAVKAHGVPIKPNLEKILKQDEQPHHFEPARAGWNGPEMVRARDATRNPVYDAYGPAATVRAVRSSLLAAVRPDPEALAAIGILIVLGRVARKDRTRSTPVTNAIAGPSGKREKAA